MITDVPDHPKVDKLNKEGSKRDVGDAHPETPYESTEDDDDLCG